LRQIIEVQADHGAPVRRIVISGGAGQDELVRQMLADTSGLPVVVTEADEPVLLGAAILGAVTSRHYSTLQAAMTAMTRTRMVLEPATADIASLHKRRFAKFERLQAAARAD
jgi:D-ribulokinase